MRDSRLSKGCSALPHAALAATTVLIAGASCAGASSREPVWAGPIPFTAAESASPLGWTSPVFAPGEQLFYRVSVQGVTVGEMVTVVGMPGVVEGRAVVEVRSRFGASDVFAAVKSWREDLDSWVDLEEGGVMRHRSSLKTGGETSILEADPPTSGDCLTMTWRRPGTSDAYLMQRLPTRGGAHDLHSALGALRARDWGEPGETASLTALGGSSLWRHVVRYSGRHSVTTPIGRFPAVRVDGAAYRLTRSNQLDREVDPRYYTAWVSSDERRLPLRGVAETRYGVVEIELIFYRPPPERLAREKRPPDLGAT